MVWCTAQQAAGRRKENRKEVIALLTMPRPWGNLSAPFNATGSSISGMSGRLHDSALTGFVLPSHSMSHAGRYGCGENVRHTRFLCPVPLPGDILCRPAEMPRPDVHRYAVASTNACTNTLVCDPAWRQGNALSGMGWCAADVVGGVIENSG